METGRGNRRRADGQAAAPAPASASAPTPVYSRPNPWSRDTVLAAHDATPWRGEVHLARAEDGHYYTTARIGNATIRAVVDTGASKIALTGADARAAGLSWDPGQVRPIARGANGEVRGIIQQVPRIDVGGIVAENVTVMIIPEGLEITLLGQNFLAQVRKVEIEGGQMILHAG